MASSRSRAPRRGGRWRAGRAARPSSRMRRAEVSRRVDVDGDGDRVADDVADGGEARQAGQLGDLVVVEVAGGADRDPDALVAGAHVVREPEEALQVDVAFDVALQTLEREPARGRVV